jgi:ligand-binding sensor domain-containing protein
MQARWIPVLYFLFTVTVSGQQYPFMRYGVAEGLPEHHITAVTTDARGFLWIATENNGVARFDGKRFRYFGGRNARISGGANALAVIDDRWLFVGVDDGVRVLRLDRHADDTPDTMMNRRLRGIDAPVRAMHVQPDRSVHIVTSDGSLRFSAADSSLTPVRTIAAPWAFLRPRLSGKELRDAARDCLGRYWGATDSGLVLLTDDALVLFGPAQGLPARNLSSVCIDHEGGIWCGSDNGLFHFVPQRFRHFPVDSGAVVRSLLESRDRELYAGTLGKGFYRFFGGESVHIDMRDGLPGNDIHAMHELVTGELLIATDNGVIVWGSDGVQPVPESLLLPDVRVRDILYARNKTYWFATMNGLVHWDGERSMVFGVSDGLPSAEITCLAEDAFGFIIVGTRNGLARVRATAGGTVSVVPELQDMHVTSLLLDRDDRLWVGTRGNGVLVRIDERVLQLGPAQGLPAGSIAFIGQDNYGGLYFGANRTISVLPRPFMQNLLPVDTVRERYRNVPPGQLPFLRMLSMYSLTREMGLQCDELQHGAVLRDAMGYMWFGGSRGVTSYNPPQPARVGQWIPPLCRGLRGTPAPAPRFGIMLGELFIDNMRMTGRSSIVMNPGDHVLRARMLMPSFRNPGQTFFLYRLRDMEYTWHRSDDGRILYTALEPGKYTLEVQATIGEGIWSFRRQLLEIEVRAPMHRHILFRFVMLLALLAVGMLLQRILQRWRVYRTKRVKS